MRHDRQERRTLPTLEEVEAHIRRGRELRSQIIASSIKH
jgi:hypothetical protein